MKHHKIIIEGINHNGQKFRPSDWADRLSGKLCSFVNQRIRYSPLLKPGINNGHRCVYVSPQLAQDDPALFWEIIDFAKQNDLKICNDSDINLELSKLK